MPSKFLSDLSITCAIDGNFGNVSPGVLFSKVAYQRKRCNSFNNCIQDFIYSIWFEGSWIETFFHFFSEEIGSRIGQNKTQATDCRLSLKCRLGPELSHRLIRNIFSIHDPILATKKLNLNGI